MKKFGLFYGSSEGNTEGIAWRIKHAIGIHYVDLLDVADARQDDIEKYQYLILATSTWSNGKLQEDWDIFIDILEATDLEDKFIAIVGLGDAKGHPDTFVDAMGIIHERIKDKGCHFIGKWHVQSYDFKRSRALINDDFVGLVIDELNQPELTDERIHTWCHLLRLELGLPAPT